MTDYHFAFTIRDRQYEVDLVRESISAGQYKITGQLAALQALGFTAPCTITYDMLKDKLSEKQATNIQLETRVHQTAMQTLVPNALSDRLAKIEQCIAIVDPQNPKVPCTVSLETLMKQYGVPGASIAIFDHGVVCHKGYGDLQNEQVLIQAASISKIVTALVVLTLVKNGTLSLQEDVSVVLKDFWDSINKKGFANADHPLTIQHLLAHTGGAAIIDPKDPKEIPIPGYPGRPKGTELAINKIIEDVKIVRTPDTSHFEYSGGGTMLLQKVIELKCNKPFVDVVREQVFLPLGMNHSTYKPPDAAKTAQGFGANGTMVSDGHFSYPEYAAAGLWSTPEDLAKIAMEIQKAYSGKESIITPDLAKKMLTAHSPDAPNGLGVFVDTLPHSVVFHHPGANGGFKCVLLGNNNDQGVCIMTNSEHGKDLWKDIMRTIAHECKWPDRDSLPMCRPICTPQQVEPVENKAAWGAKYAGLYSYVDREGRRQTIEVTPEYLREEGSPPYPITYLGKEVSLFLEFTPGPPQKFYFTEDASGKITLHVFDNEFSR